MLKQLSMKMVGGKEGESKRERGQERKKAKETTSLRLVNVCQTDEIYFHQ